ncbi:hypothetical protein KGP26_15350 [Serratia sp. JSRIV002]|uniref:hypothetical protein n=1 Tax=Serratia sp. JSRIV002 TaxID=2831894 RepID=UPI001CC013D8|nr:hypothetical protein [Serratia sp. JSRIV002]UAN49176.1 hypothetical protein KGP26_15350 [Serratia sp. JSRIV002]
MSLDHGLLNLPLNKRGGGDFHKELDAYLADQKAMRAEAHKANTLSFNERKAAALEAFKQISDELVEQHAKRLGIRAASLRKNVREDCSVNPNRAMAAIKALTA